MFPILAFREHFSNVLTSKPRRLANRLCLCHDEFSYRVSIPALLAQLAEQLTLNQRVSGSSPEGGISNNNRRAGTDCQAVGLEP
jgi:hypothetical protein